ncbi:hypothetical protein [Lignipirellula cremea]|nr:hypothetical protein [Lignipirellula cremea]
MHARELIELAAMLATRAETFVEFGEPPAAAAVEGYWSASKCRLDRWYRAMKLYNSQRQAGDNSTQAWRRLRPVLEEVLASEMLTRVWTAVASAHDHLHQSRELEPIARSVLIGHLEARHRALNLMVYGKGFDVAEAVELNRIRRRAERWTDLLLARLADQADVHDLAFDMERTSEFGRDLREEPHPGRSWNLMLASLRAGFRVGLSPGSPNADLNEQIASSLISCWGPELFDDTGVAKSLWMMRVAKTTSDAEGLIDELIAIDDAVPAPHVRFNNRRGAGRE